MVLNEQTFTVAALAIMETLSETRGSEGPEGHLYMALMGAGYTLNDFQVVVRTLVDGGLVVRTAGPRLKLTVKGEVAAARCKVIRAQAKKGQN